MNSSEEPEGVTFAFTAAGRTVNMRIHCQPGEFSDEYLDYLKEIVKQDIELCLGDYLKDKKSGK